MSQYPSCRNLRSLFFFTTLPKIYSWVQSKGGEFITVKITVPFLFASFSAPLIRNFSSRCIRLFCRGRGENGTEVFYQIFLQSRAGAFCIIYIRKHSGSAGIWSAFRADRYPLREPAKWERFPDKCTESTSQYVKLPFYFPFYSPCKFISLESSPPICYHQS